MEIEAKFTVASPELLARLLNVTEIGPYQLIPFGEESVIDRYCDTADQDVRKAGYAFRYREKNNRSLATLKGLGGVNGSVHQREEFEGEVPANSAPADWPPSDLRDRVQSILHAKPLEELFVIRQRRAKRILKQEDRTLGELSLDTVDTEAGGQVITTYDVELELKESGTEDDLKQFEELLKEYALVPEPQSKFERALAQNESLSSDPLLLTALEKTQLSLLADGSDEVLARRAKMILLNAAGKTSLEIGQEVGISDSYVRRWLRNWRAHRMSLFPSPTEKPEAEPKLIENPATAKDDKKKKKESKETAAPPPPQPVSILQLCARYAVDMKHARHVADMSLALFDHFPQVHGLPVERRNLMEAAGLLHNIGLSVNPDKHHIVGRDLIRAERIEGLSETERDILACTTRFHRKKVNPEKEKIYQALPKDIQRDVLAFSALLRAGDAFDYSVTQTSKLVSAKLKEDEAVVILDGPHAKHEAERAVQKADLWNQTFSIPIKVLAAEDVPEPIAPEPIAVEVSVGKAAPSPKEETTPEEPAPKRKSPGVKAEDAMTEAGRKVLGFHYERLLENEEGTREGVDPEALHDMRVAARRMRSAMRLFGPYLPKKQVEILTDGLRKTGRALGSVRDLDVIMGKARKFRDSLPDDEAPDFEVLFRYWEKQRKAARKRMTDYLDSKDYAGFKRDFERFLRSRDEVKPKKKT